MKHSVVIVGLGNILCGDEGVGVHVVRSLLEKPSFPEGVRVLEGGTLGPDLLAYLDPGEAVVLLDAVRAGRSPGSVVRLDLASLEPMGPIPLSVHDLGVRELVLQARLLGRELRGVLLGVEPQRIVPGEMRLSAPVQGALSLLEEMALSEALRLLREEAS